MSVRHLFQKFWYGVTGFWRIHFSVPSILIIVAVAALLYHYMIRHWIEPIASAFGNYDPNSFLHTLATGTISAALSALLFGTVGVMLFGWYTRIRQTGRYKTYDLADSTNPIEWGEVTVKYMPLSGLLKGTALKLCLKHNDVILEGHGLTLRESYMLGYYVETGDPGRRRFGVFLYSIDGSGRQWEGNFLYVDPDSDGIKQGKARWIKYP
jgi:hypothetical protein